MGPITDNAILFTADATELCCSIHHNVGFRA